MKCLYQLTVVHLHPFMLFDVIGIPALCNIGNNYTDICFIAIKMIKYDKNMNIKVSR